jgi:hypothetical protein
MAYKAVTIWNDGNIFTEMLNTNVYGVSTSLTVCYIEIYYWMICVHYKDQYRPGFEEKEGNGYPNV